MYIQVSNVLFVVKLVTEHLLVLLSRLNNHTIEYKVNSSTW